MEINNIIFCDVLTALYIIIAFQVFDVAFNFFNKENFENKLFNCLKALCISTFWGFFIIILLINLITGEIRFDD